MGQQMINPIYAEKMRNTEEKKIDGAVFGLLNEVARNQCF